MNKKLVFLGILVLVSLALSGCAVGGYGYPSSYGYPYSYGYYNYAYGYPSRYAYGYPFSYGYYNYGYPYRYNLPGRLGYRGYWGGPRRWRRF
ncbi:MAG TPA: hypothetical protein VEF33_00130 [Syntrophales bacterium]|nr:hypothetical protein [Syntrophales bacterium]